MLEVRLELSIVAPARARRAARDVGIPTRRARGLGLVSHHGDALNDALGTDLPVSFLAELGRETLELELAFNKAAGFTEEDDELPAFFYAEPVAPTDKVARHHTAEVNQARSAWFAQG